MIVLYNSGNIPVITINQTEHARIAGIIAGYFDYKLIPGFPEKVIGHFIHAVTHHDDGWIQWENDHKYDTQGIPVDFKDMPTDMHIDIWKQSITQLSTYHPYESWLVINHALHLYSDYIPESLPAHDMKLEPIGTQILDFINWLTEKERTTYSKISTMEFPWNKLTKSEMKTHQRLLSFFDSLTLIMLDAVPFIDNYLLNEVLTLSLIRNKTQISICPWPFIQESITIEFNTNNDKSLRSTLIKKLPETK